MSAPYLRPAVAAMHAYVPGEQPEGDRVLKLNTNENPYPPSPKVFDALGSLSADDLRRYPQPTARKLRAAIAALHQVDPAQVFVGNGSDEVLALMTRAFAPAGGRVGFLSPSYSLYPVLAEIAELQTVTWPLAEDFTWAVPASLDVDLFFLTQPNAPTSLALPLAEVRNAARACRGVFVVDEAYADFAEETAVALLAEFPNVMISRSFSKSYSLAGLRVGYALGPAPLIAALDTIKDSYNLDVLAQRMALAAVEDQAWMLQNVTAVRGTRAAVAQALTRRGFAVLPSQTNFVFARVSEGQSAAAIYAALRDRQVFVRYFPGPATGDWLRITIGTDAQMDRFLAELDALLSAGVSGENF